MFDTIVAIRVMSIKKEKSEKRDALQATQDLNVLGKIPVDVFACCKPNRGNLVGKITWSVCFAPRNTSCLRLFVQIREFLKRRTLATLATTEHLFACV